MREVFDAQRVIIAQEGNVVLKLKLDMKKEGT